EPGDARELQALAKKAGAHVQAVDVCDDDQVRAFAAAVGDAPIDLLVNNAGIAGSWNTTLATFDAEEALRCFDTNALGAIRVTRALLSNLRAARGKVINMTSRMGSIGDNGSGRGYAYRMSKAALNMATRNIAHEVKAFGGIAVALHPGWVKTEMGGEGASEEIADAIARITKLVERLAPDDSGRFWHASGEELPW
ncbi:MAG TPA: SDR family oxidoreductase, partial [Polyangia bacterium]|nr:SDR family oxidoreductase [Polyangia bacterium]